nr:hypothetical protein [Tanacetum cinerariifolium]
MYAALQGRCSREARSKYNTKLAQLLPRHIYLPYVVNGDVLNQMGYDGEIDDMLRIRLHEAGSDEEIFTSSKNIIKFRLGGRAHNLTLLEFARRLGLYQAELNFKGDVQNDHLWFVSKDNWVIAKWMKRKGAGTQCNAPLKKKTKVSNGSSDGIATIANKLDSLRRDMKKLKENVHAIQLGCETYGRAHLDKECPLHEDVKSIEEVKYGEFGRSFPNNSINGARYRVGPQDTIYE